MSPSPTQQKPWEVFDTRILPHLRAAMVFKELPIKKKTVRGWWCSCPFHNDTRTSLLLNPKNLLWYCFDGCGGGGPIEFVQKLHGTDWLGSFLKLAEQAHIDISPPDTGEDRWTDDDFRLCSDQYRRYLLMELFARHTQDELLSESSQAQLARDYLKRRGFSLEVVQALSLGLYTRQEEVGEFLEKRGQNFDEASALGIFHPQMVGRITSQWRDVHGRVINMWGRLMHESRPGQSTYVHLPCNAQLPPFGSVSVPFNLDRAARADKRDLIMFETPFKALLPYTIGLGFRIGPFPISSHSGLVKDQIDVLTDYLGEDGSLTLCMDYAPRTYGTERDRTMTIANMLNDLPFKLFVVDPIIMAEKKYTEPMEPDKFIMTHGGLTHGLDAFISILARCPGLNLYPEKTSGVESTLTHYIEKDLWGKWSRLIEDEILESD